MKFKDGKTFSAYVRPKLHSGYTTSQELKLYTRRYFTQAETRTLSRTHIVTFGMLLNSWNVELWPETKWTLLWFYGRYFPQVAKWITGTKCTNLHTGVSIHEKYTFILKWARAFHNLDYPIFRLKCYMYWVKVLKLTCVYSCTNM